MLSTLLIIFFLTDTFRENSHIYTLNAPSTSTQHLLPIGFTNVVEGKTHVGNDIWIDSEAFELVIANKSFGIVIRDLCRALFSEDELFKSTVTGKPTNKNKKQKEQENVNQLSGSKVNAIRDTWEYYINKRHPNMSQMKKDQIIAKVRPVIASLIADINKKKKGNEIQSNKSNNEKMEKADEEMDAIKETTQDSNLNSTNIKKVTEDEETRDISDYETHTEEIQEEKALSNPNEADTKKKRYRRGTIRK